MPYAALVCGRMRIYTYAHADACAPIHMLHSYADVCSRMRGVSKELILRRLPLRMHTSALTNHNMCIRKMRRLVHAFRMHVCGVNAGGGHAGGVHA